MKTQCSFFTSLSITGDTLALNPCRRGPRLDKPFVGLDVVTVDNMLEVNAGKGVEPRELRRVDVLVLLDDHRLSWELEGIDHIM
jgi:hypothetical protein